MLVSGQEISISAPNIKLSFDRNLHSRVSARFGGEEIPLGAFDASEVLLVGGKEMADFALIQRQESMSGLLLKGRAGGVEKTVTVDRSAAFPAMLFLKVEYRNVAAEPLRVDGWVNMRHTITAHGEKSSPAFWSLQNGSYEKRPNWVLPVSAPFKQQNYLGMNADDYGGGTPVLDIWRRDVGLAIGHLELVPKLVSFPVEMPDPSGATVRMEYRHPTVLKPGETLRTFDSFVAVHQGDFFSTLQDYHRVMVEKGVRFSTPPDGGFDPIWCAWGFGRNFQPQQLINALPTVKRLGFKWVTMDDGWQTSEGDWKPNPQKFPRGDADVRALVDKIHAAGFRAQLWWSPMSVSPKSDLFRQHPDWLLLDEKHERRKISWWNTFYLCPAYQPVVEYHRALAEKAMRDWGFDGLKIDGQFLNAVPPCTNPAHHHNAPEDSAEAVPYFFKAISEGARAVKPGALIELCPCGTSYSFFTMPYYNMTVASDPESSFQVRSKGKALKALFGDKLPYFGDHVELSDGGMDFASTVGVGGVIGTEFRWPPNDDKASPPSDSDAAKLRLTPEKEKIWAEWVKIYTSHMLSQGSYTGGLYDIGFDKPETHVVRKGAATYYAFFAPQWRGRVSLRGLPTGRYRVVDYVHHAELGTVNAPDAQLSVEFKGSLLVMAEPLAR